MSAKNWCFTFNDGDDSLLEGESLVDITSSLAELSTVPAVSYLVFQLERGSTGTRHLQGYTQLGSRASLARIRALFPMIYGAHWEVAKGSPSQNKDYCTKEESRIDGPWEYGEMSTAGKRTDIDLFMKAMPMTIDEIYDRFPSIIAKYPKFVSSVIRRHHQQEPQGFDPRDGWQTDLVSYLNSPAHPRKLRWYFDEIGNAGKSFFARNFGRGVGYIVTGGKHADIYYAYSFQPVVFFDWPRAQEEAFPYSVVESFKNGYFLSTKYESAPVRFATPHVVVLANFEPQREKLSEDRWEIISI